MVKFSAYVELHGYTCADPLSILIRAEAGTVEEEQEADALEAEQEAKWLAGTCKVNVQFQTKE